MKKALAIKITGNDEGLIYDTEIESGTTVGDVLKSLNLEEYALFKGEDSRPLPAGTNLYPIISNGDKLLASPKMEAGKE